MILAAGDLHLIKLCVGVEHPDELAKWQAKRRKQTGRSASFHVTRMWPKRKTELLDGGSLYWVMKGFIKARQEIVGMEPVEGEDGISRCAFLLNPDIVKVELTPRKAFQGWRYLQGIQVPRDIIETGDQGEHMPENLRHELARLGVRRLNDVPCESFDRSSS